MLHLGLKLLSVRFWVEVLTTAVRRPESTYDLCSFNYPLIHYLKSVCRKLFNLLINFSHKFPDSLPKSASYRLLRLSGPTTHQLPPVRQSSVNNNHHSHLLTFNHNKMLP